MHALVKNDPISFKIRNIQIDNIFIYTIRFVTKIENIIIIIPMVIYILICHVHINIAIV